MILPVNMNILKTAARLLYLVCALAFITACDSDVTKSGNDITQNFQLASFDRIEIASGFKLDILQEDTQEVNISADANYMPHIVCKVEGNTLKIHREDNYSFNDSRNVKISVSIPKLSYISSSGGCYISTNGTYNTSNMQGISLASSGGSQWQVDFRGDAAINISSAGGSIFLSNFETSALNIDASGGSEFTLIGSATDLYCKNISGGSKISAYGLLTDNSDVEASGGSVFHLNVANSLKVNASGGSKIYYKGTGKITYSELNGGSKVEHVP